MCQHNQSVLQLWTPDSLAEASGAAAWVSSFEATPCFSTKLVNWSPKSLPGLCDCNIVDQHLFTYLLRMQFITSCKSTSIFLTSVRELWVEVVKAQQNASERDSTPLGMSSSRLSVSAFISLSRITAAAWWAPCPASQSAVVLCCQSAVALCCQSAVVLCFWKYDRLYKKGYNPAGRPHALYKHATSSTMAATAAGSGDAAPPDLSAGFSLPESRSVR